MSYARVFSAQSGAVEAKLIELELNLKEKGISNISIVGLPDKAVEEAKERVSAALDNASFEKDSSFRSLKSYHGKITISLSPAELKKSGALFDLPMALAYLSAQQALHLPEDSMFAGELALDGSIKPIKGALSIAILAKEKGFKTLVLPKENQFEAMALEGLKVAAYGNLAELVEDLKKGSIKSVKTSANLRKRFVYKPRYLLDDIKGQALAKRALTIAAAGGHNLALYGPPGTGKSMLARVFAEIMPDLDRESSLELSKIYSSKGLLKGRLIERPPVRAPHHSASYAAILGGGSNISPGELSLAHKGVLFLDEFPEFDRRVINALREPLEEKKITISRAGASETFPADFILIAALNPCPCGYYGTDRCSCSIASIRKYQSKISGPIADRIDIWVELSQVEYEKLLTNEARSAKEHNLAIKQVREARKIQKERFLSNALNANMSAAAINKFINIDDKIKKLLNSSAERLGLSGRAYHKILKLARTIADIESSPKIKQEHVLEALQYREKIVQV